MERNQHLSLTLPIKVPLFYKDCFKLIELTDLQQKDFRVLEDGVEQTLNNVVFEPTPETRERDVHSELITNHIPNNPYVEFHEIWSYTPRSFWRSADLPSSVQHSGISFYRVSYAPQKTRIGDCHRLKVSVQKPHAEVIATDRYCYLPHAATDALAGTALADSLASELTSHYMAPEIPLLAQAGVFCQHDSKTTVNIVLEFPSDKLKNFSNGTVHGEIGILGVAYAADGREIERFSDAAIVRGDLLLGNSNFKNAALPSRYETQIDLPAGNYELRVSLSDGTKFGRTVIPIHIDELDSKAPSLSSLFLFKRFRNAGVAQQEAEKVNLAPAFVRLVSQEINITPTADPSFHPKDVLPVYFEVYEPAVAEKPAANVEVHMRIVDPKTQEVKQTFPWFDAEPYRRSGTNTFAIHKFLYTGELGIGEYRLEAQAKDDSGQISKWQTTEFTIK